MAFNVIETPGIPNGDERQQIEQMYNYLLRLSQDLNINLDMIGSNDLTDDERQVMTQILAAAGAQAGAAAGSAEAGLTEMESLKSLIIKTAKFVQTKLDEYRMNLVRETVAEGTFGKYVRNTKLDLEITPEGITQEYKFHEAVNGIKDYELNTKAYIKTGQLRTVNNVPVFGVAIGQGVVTFNNDGTEVYHGENRVAELTADELTFYRKTGDNSNEVLAKYAGNRIGFYYQGNEVFYIAAGKVYCAKDLEITSGGKLIINGGSIDVNTNNFVISSFYRHMKSGYWTYEENGIRYYRSDIQIPGAAKEIVLTTSQAGAILKAESVGADRFTGICIKNDTILPTGQIKQGDYYIDGGPVSLGSSSYKFQNVYAENLYGTLVNASSREVKHNIQPMPEMGRRLDRLQPVTFVYNVDEKERTRYGLIYEDTVGVMPEICTAEGEEKAINYVELVPMLLREIQDLRARVRALEEIQEG